MQQKNDRTIARGLILIALYVFTSFILEIINFVCLGMGVLPSNILLDISFWLIVAGILFVIPSDIARIVISAVLVFFQAAMNIANEILMGITSSVFHISQLKQVSEGTEGFDWGLINWWVVAINILVFAAFLTVAIVLRLKIKSGLDEKIKKKLVTILAGILCFEAVGVSFAFIGDSVFKNSHGKIYSQAYAGESVLWNGMYFRNETFKTLGTFGFYTKDIITEIGYSSKLNAEQTKAIQNALSNSMSDTSTYSNIAVGDNLIYILLESFDTFALDPYNTPNLWKMMYGDDATYADKTEANASVKQGTYFSNFHGFNYTNDSEVISIMGHTTIKNRLYDTYRTIGIEVPYSLPNLFKNAGYESVNYFHGYIKRYYNRNELNKAIGFENVYGIEDSKFKTSTFGGWIKDSEYIDDMMSKFIPEGKKFFSYYTSITGHGPYDYKNENLDENKAVYDSNYEKYEAFMKKNGYYLPTDEKTSEYLRQYKASMIDDDKMVGNIFAELERQGILDKTTIVMFADHNCFYHDMSSIMKEVKNVADGEIELYNIPLFIYNDSLTAGVNDTFCNTYDLYPTICSMFGFEYNTALTHGYDIYSESIKNSLFASFKTGVFNENYYTYNLYEIAETNNKNLKEQDKFIEQILNFYKKQNVIENIYKTKYLKVV